MQSENFHIFSPEPWQIFIQNLHEVLVFLGKEIQFSSNEGHHLYSKQESNSKLEKYINSFKQFFPEKQLSSIFIIT